MCSVCPARSPMTNAVEPDRSTPAGSRSPDARAAGPADLPTASPTASEVHHHLAALRSVHDELARVATALQRGASAARHDVDGAVHDVVHRIGDVGRLGSRCPAWLRPTDGENRWPVAGCILVAILLQVALPDRLSLLNRWLLPSVELALLVALLIAVPRRFHRQSRPLRVASLSLTGLMTVANGWSAAVLVVGLVAGTLGSDAGPLLSTGAAIWLTNVIAFGLWYWQFDRGGPAARAHAVKTLPDFQFVQMQTPQMAHPAWEPGFVDYLYLSFTNATAFSPTDVLPLSRWAKLMMLVQSLVSLVTVALVIARAVNVLK